jgi:hypothetical protein
MSMHQILDLDDEIVYKPKDTATTDEQGFASYITWVSVVVACGALSVMLFVAAVDPYHLFRFIDVEGFNRVKPLPGQYREQIKLAQAKALQPNAMLFGNSRIEVGFDPKNPHLRAQGYSAYNLALSGTTITVAERMLSQMRSEVAPPAMAVVGVEFLDFLVDPAAVPAAPSEHSGQRHLEQWHFDTLFSMKSLSDAWQTVQLQKASDPETMTSRGQTPLLEYKEYARREGYHIIFQQRAQENAKALVRKPHSLYGANKSSASIDRLGHMLTTMAQDNTDVHLVIYPYHAQLMAMFNEAGLETTMEEWKSLLVREVEAVQRQHRGARITLWDFSGFGTVQCEPIPLPGDTHSTTRFYWEAGHFKSSVGDLILQRILTGDAPLGVALTAANLAQNRQRIAAERAQCAGMNPEVFSAARSLIGAARVRQP